MAGACHRSGVSECEMLCECELTICYVSSVSSLLTGDTCDLLQSTGKRERESGPGEKSAPVM